MLSKLLGIIWILLGILWLVDPQRLKTRLQGKMNRKMKRVVFGFILVFGLLMIGSVFRTSGILPKIIGIAGMVLVIKGIILITSKTSDKIFEWLGSRSLKYFRIWALVLLALGLMMIFA
ncbi:MAG: hypothetical protein WBD24_02035 [Candidatus Omnitrophota bacterium]